MILAATAALILLWIPVAGAQDLPKLVIDQDCSAFAISPRNDIVFSVPHLKFIKKYILQRDDIYIARPKGGINRIVDADKFIPFPPVEGFIVRSFSWSPDGKRIAINMTLRPLPARLEEQIEEKKSRHKVKKQRDDQDDEDDDSGDFQTVKPPQGGNVVALFDADGRPIQVPGAKTQFLDHAENAAWLDDDQAVVYLSGAQIVRLRPADGTTTKLFEGHEFQAVAWDPARSRAFAVGEDLTVHAGLALVELDLLHETIAPIATLPSYQSSLTVSPSGTKVGFFADGDTIEVIDIGNASRPLRVHAGLGFFQWDSSEDRVLLKRGPQDQSNDLVWVGLHDDSFVPALHDLEFHAFQVAPDGKSLAVTEPGKRILKIYPLE
ncbi:MAG: PD40 domain-containing protein [Acidobacteriota bacterium]|nr:PD40 domain-containing protein [Acidobacteriota bacterium]